MRFLILGQGGREHALIRALKFSPSITEIHAAPGSQGISQEAICHAVDLGDASAVEAFVGKYRFDCVIIGPEQYLVEGLADRLRALGVNVVGPSAAAARLEGSKVFAKEFMKRAGIPTARYEVVGTVEATLDAATRFTPPYVLKADGLAAGKGVFICATLSDLRRAATDLFEARVLGEAGARAVLEQFQDGYEISYLVLTDGRRAEALPLAQDHKRLGDGDVGPNTGGMGVVAPVEITADLRARIEAQLIQPSVRQLDAENLLYRGVLYVGVMVTAEGPTVLEYNVRFGDPEAQVILPLLDGDWAKVFSDLGRGELRPLRWTGMHTACVVEAALGYPDAPVKGDVIEGDLGYQTHSSYFLHAGTAKSKGGQWIVNGGRVLNAVGMGNSLAEALREAYAQAGKVSWRGLQMRKDIGARQVD